RPVRRSAPRPGSARPRSPRSSASWWRRGSCARPVRSLRREGAPPPPSRRTRAAARCSPSTSPRPTCAWTSSTSPWPGSTPGAPSSDTVADHMRVCTDALLGRHPELDGEVLGAGISLPGQVDPVRGVDVFAPNWDWHEVPLMDALEQAVPVPIRIDNPLMALATGELWFGAGRHFRHFVAVNLGTGGGAGVIVDGTLLRGRGNSA